MEPKPAKWGGEAPKTDSKPVIGPDLPNIPSPSKSTSSPVQRYYAVPIEQYDVVKADPNKWEENEIVGVVAGAVAAFVAALLIFMPLSGIQRETSFSAGLTLFGAGVGYALRSVQKK